LQRISRSIRPADMVFYDQRANMVNWSWRKIPETGDKTPVVDVKGCL